MPAEAKPETSAGSSVYPDKKQYVFPEIEYDNVDSVRGMDIIFVTSAKSDEEARELLNGFDFPFNQ